MHITHIYRIHIGIIAGTYTQTLVYFYNHKKTDIQMIMAELYGNTKQVITNALICEEKSYLLISSNCLLQEKTYFTD